MAVTTIGVERVRTQLSSQALLSDVYRTIFIDLTIVISRSRIVVACVGLRSAFGKKGPGHPRYLRLSLLARSDPWRLLRSMTRLMRIPGQFFP